jgi:hypothetical protein
VNAQPITFKLKDSSLGYEISPERVPLAVLRDFSRDVEEFIRGDEKSISTAQLEVAVIHGSLAVQTAPIHSAALFQDLMAMLQNQIIDGLQAKRRDVVVRIQKWAKTHREAQFVMESPALDQPIVINSQSDYRTDDADQWVQVERYLRGEMENLGGSSVVNAHMRLPDGRRLTVQTSKDLIRSDKINRLYKPAMVRIRASFNVMTGEYRDAELIEFVEHENKPDMEALRRGRERAAIAWADVPDSSAWVEQIRGNTP